MKKGQFHRLLELAKTSGTDFSLFKTEKREGASRKQTRPYLSTILSWVFGPNAKATWARIEQEKMLLVTC